MTASPRGLAQASTDLRDQKIASLAAAGHDGVSAFRHGAHAVGLGIHGHRLSPPSGAQLDDTGRPNLAAIAIRILLNMFSC